MRRRSSSRNAVMKMLKMADFCKHTGGSAAMVSGQTVLAHNTKLCFMFHPTQKPANSNRFQTT